MAREHHVHNPALSDEENTRLFGKCNNPNWHGHNYILDVSVEGAVDPRTGYVLDLSSLKQLVNREVIDRPGFQAKLRALRERWQGGVAG